MAQAQERLKIGDPKDSETIAKRLKAWQRDPRLAGVHDEDRLIRLPASERADWNRFWADVKTQLPAKNSK